VPAGAAPGGGQQNMAEVYQAAYAAAFYAQQQQLQQILRLQAQAQGGNLNQAALAALLAQGGNVNLANLGLDAGAMGLGGAMNGGDVGGFGGAGNRGAAGGMGGGGRDKNRGNRNNSFNNGGNNGGHNGGLKGNRAGSFSNANDAAALLGGGMNRSGSMNGLGGDSAQEIADMDARFGSVQECVGQVGVLARDQHGCRFLQRKFDEEGEEAVNLCFEEIIAEVVDLMMDPFGNYLVQKLLECCSDEQRMGMLRAVAKVRGENDSDAENDKDADAADKDASDEKKEDEKKPAVAKPSSSLGSKDGDGVPELVSVALNTHGTRAVQKLVETLRTPEQVALATEALKPGVVTLIKDLNGNHVIQRCLQRLGAEDNQFVYDAARRCCVEIATHRHGCCVLQRCIDHAADGQRRALVQEIAAQALVLSQDPFGNYVVQYILDLALSWANGEVMMRLAGNYAELSMQKFSSNVVEKCLKLADSSLEEHRNVVVREIMTSPLLDRLLMDPYGNYVVQSTLSVTKGQLHSELVDRIRPHLPLIKNSPFGKRILRLLLENKK
jgi:pumilio RNA-binding family